MGQVRLEDARRVIAAAEKKAAEIGQPMNIAIADEGGNIVAHVRMDNAWIGSIDISQKKAYTSRAFDIQTKDLATHSQSGGQFFGIHASNNGKIMIFAGGIPLKKDGKVVGAIGVSGGSGDQDHAVAAAGAACFLVQPAQRVFARSGDAGDETGAPAPGDTGTFLVTKEIWYGEQSWSCLRWPGESRSQIDRLPEVKDARERNQPVRRERRPTRRHFEGCDDQHLRVRSAHGSRPHHGPERFDSRTRDHRRSCRKRRGRRDAEHR